MSLFAKKNLASLRKKLRSPKIKKNETTLTHFCREKSQLAKFLKCLKKQLCHVPLGVHNNWIKPVLLFKAWTGWCPVAPLPPVVDVNPLKWVEKRENTEAWCMLHWAGCVPLLEQNIIHKWANVLLCSILDEIFTYLTQLLLLFFNSLYPMTHKSIMSSQWFKDRVYNNTIEPSLERKKKHVNMSLNWSLSILFTPHCTANALTDESTFWTDLDKCGALRPYSEWILLGRGAALEWLSAIPLWTN